MTAVPLTTRIFRLDKAVVVVAEDRLVQAQRPHLALDGFQHRDRSIEQRLTVKANWGQGKGVRGEWGKRISGKRISGKGVWW